MDWYFSDACDATSTTILTVAGLLVFVGLILATVYLIAAGHDTLAAITILLACGCAVGGTFILVRR